MIGWDDIENAVKAEADQIRDGINLDDSHASIGVNSAELYEYADETVRPALLEAVLQDGIQDGQLELELGHILKHTWLIGFCTGVRAARADKDEHR